jgi:LysM repeat protein
VADKYRPLTLDKSKHPIILHAMKLTPSHVFLLLAPFILANCRSTKADGSSSSGSGTPSHNMSRAEYPFDENGNYREDWVKGTNDNAVASADNRSVVDLTTNNPPSPFLGTTDERDNKPAVTSRSSGSSSSKKTSSSSSKKVASSSSSSKSKPKPKKPAPKSTTVLVKKGDSLYGLAKRYGTSVKAIQSANGMGSSTVLRDGKSIKIPR